MKRYALLPGLLFSIALACSSVPVTGTTTKPPVLNTPNLPTGILNITFLDVGQGDAVLIQTPDGKSALYDAGRTQTRAAELLTAEGISTLDLAVASHADADHIGGFIGVAPAFKPKAFLDNGVPGTTLVYANVVQAMLDAGAQGLLPTARTINLGNDVKLEVMPSGVSSSDQNADSLGLLVTFGKFASFMGGDSEPATQTEWLNRFASKLECVRVYKASHHGSKFNETSNFLNKLKPLDVAIGVGASNPYGHPTAEALALYAAQGSSVWRTDTQGSITFAAKADGSYSIQTDTGVTESRSAASGCQRAYTVPPVVNPPSTTPTNPPSVCCKVCRTGKPCGDSCIARDKTCRQPPGCACSVAAFGTAGTQTSALEFGQQSTTCDEQNNWFSDAISDRPIDPKPWTSDPKSLSQNTTRPRKVAANLMPPPTWLVPTWRVNLERH